MTAFFGIYEKTQQISSYVKFPTLHVHHATKNVFIKLTMLLPSYFIHSVSRKASASMYCCAHLTLILICQKDMYDTHFIRYDAFVLFSRQTQLSSAWNCFNAMKRYTANFSWYIIIFFLYWYSIRPFWMCCTSYSSSTIKNKSSQRDGQLLLIMLLKIFKNALLCETL